MLLKPNTVNQLLRGTVIFQEQEEVTYICMVLKGRITAINHGSRIVLTQGCMFGIHDLFLGRYLSNYVASEDVVIYPFPVSGVDSLHEIFAFNKDYQGVIIYSLCYYIRELSRVLEEISRCDESLYEYLKEEYAYYVKAGHSNKFPVYALPKIEELVAYNSDIEFNHREADFFCECSNLPLTAVKAFYGHSESMTMSHVEEACSILANITLQCLEITSHLEEGFLLLMNNSEMCLFKREIALYQDFKKDGFINQELMHRIDNMVDRINSIDKVLSLYTNHSVTLDRKEFEELYLSLVVTSESQETTKDETADIKAMVDSLSGSMRQIFSFIELEKEKEIAFSTAVEYFVNAEDRLSPDDEMRLKRKEITKYYYEIYERAFLIAYKKQKAIPKVIDLFLKYGLVDERLLTEQQLYSLCKLDAGTTEGPCRIYTLYEWLSLIMQGKKEPSKSEFDLDYVDHLRTMRKKGDITEKEEKELLVNVEKKLHYEITNMFAYNNKLLNGQISIFLPILYKEQFYNVIERAFVTKERINDSFSKVLEIDYSAFHREALYVNVEAGIEKEYIMKQVLPEIIILPISGSNGSMWQEISGKRRNNPGRFLFPHFIDSNLDDIMIRLFGRFRWELCRCIQGTAWNDLKHKSLTSEYVDYIQFYRRNHDLSEERKEKLKLQIQKGRNNTREIFVLDYEAWIKGEAFGAIRLNKVARELLATYCPFSKEIREKLIMQPLFVEAFGRFQRNTAKKLRELELRFHALAKERIELTKELENTMSFYRDL
nr:cyclic nucleotide-binding domain-containing protein [uncultured Lachnoclostridium sp.]